MPTHFQDLLAAASILAGCFLAGRYMGLLEAKIKNGKSNDLELYRAIGSLEQRIEELSDQITRHHRRGSETHRGKSTTD